MASVNYLSEKNTVFFSTANDTYVLKAAASLLSIRNFLPEATLYILSRHVSNKNKRILKRHNINYIEIDLTYLFFQTYDYPIECFYLFAGPKLFSKLGFDYSVYIDGDVLCLNNPLKRDLNIKDLGGVEVNTFAALFGDEQSALIDWFNLDPKEFHKKRLQSGVIYMNNQRLEALHFLEKAGELFYECWKNGSPRKGDDSLFALIQLANKEKISIKPLPSIYNYIPAFQKVCDSKDVILFHFASLDKPWKVKPCRHSDAQQNIFNDFIKSWRKYNRKISFFDWVNTLFMPNLFYRATQKIIKLLNRTSFVLNGTRLSVFRKRQNLKKPPIKLYWWQPANINNFGDLVSKDIILNLFGRTVDFSTESDCDMVATGSILEIMQMQRCTRRFRFYVWGSGFIDESSNGTKLEKAIFLAVRGVKTRAKVHKKIPTGDPGILINATYALKRNKRSKKVGVVIHYADMQLPLVKKLCEDERFNIISPLEQPEKVAEQIADCGLVLSSSLHGLIFADSLSVPNAHLKLSDNLTGGEYKFKDYCSGVGKKYQRANVEKIFDDDYLETLRRNYEPIPSLTKKQRKLIEVFPFK